MIYDVVKNRLLLDRTIYQFMDILVNGEWSTWTTWGECDCNTLQKSRSRSCSGTANGGVCVGNPDGSEGETESDSQSCTCPGILHVFYMGQFR